MTPACPACRSANTINCGPLPPFRPGVFGGEKLDAAIAPGDLIHCPRCDLKFRYPALSDEALTRLYEDLPDSVWHSDEPRPYWRQAADLLDQFASSNRLLDVGCFTGDFMAWLPASWKKLGIEPSRNAAERAAASGIEMIGHSVAEFDASHVHAGAITIFDVIEHVTQPVDFLRKLKSALAPDGSLILLTGATDTWPFRLLGRHYWYSSLPEHVSFYSVAWFHWVAEQLGMKVVHASYLSSEKREFRAWLTQGVQIAAYAIVRRLREAGWPEAVIRCLPVIRRACSWTVVPWWKQAHDHLFVVLK